MKKDDAIVLVLAELYRAQKKHPRWPADNIHRAAIVGEEAGEPLQAAIDYTYSGGSINDVRTEAIQTAAMALRLLISLP